jgi:signal transduction histidine kinase
MHRRYAELKPRIRQLAPCLVMFVAMFGAMPTAWALEKITLQLKWTHAFQFAGYYAAKAQGYYDAAGLDVAIAEAAPDTDVVGKVLGGSAQYGVSSSNLLLDRAAGKPVVALAVVFQQSPYQIYTSSKISGLHDLNGKRIMLEPQSQELLALLLKKQVSLAQMQQVPHSFDADSLMTGAVDAMSGYMSDEPFYFMQAGYSFHAFSPRSVGIDFYGDNLFTSEQELKAHPARVKAFRTASLRGWQYAKSHPEEIIDLILAQYSQKRSREHLQFEVDQMVPLLQPNLIEVGYMNPARWQAIADTYASIGLLPAGFKAEGFLFDAAEPDNTPIYKAVAGLLALLGISVAIAAYIARSNQRLLASEKQTRRAADALRQALAEQHHFIDMLTHELKIPLSILRIDTDAMQAQGMDKQYASRALDEMTGIVERCQQLDELTHQKVSVQAHCCDLKDVFAALAAGRRADDRVRVRWQDVPQIQTDPQLLRIILTNLASNAVKYSPDDSVIDIIVESAAREGINGVQISVQNMPSAAGVPDPARVFSKYYRSPGAHRKTGTGLGLYLARALTDLLGGHMSYTGEPDKITFTLWLPNSISSS